MSCKTKFGVSFHAYMSVEDIARFWCQRVTAEVKAAYPSIDQALQQAQILILEYRHARVTLKIAMDTYKDVQIAISAGSATIAGQIGPWLTAKAGLVTESGVADLAAFALSDIEATATAGFTCPPSENTIPEKDLTQIEIDIRNALTLLLNPDCDF